jgi:hypothetical protein
MNPPATQVFLSCPSFRGSFFGIRDESSELGLNRHVAKPILEKGASSPFAQAKRTEFPSPPQRGCKTLLHRENFTAKARRRKANVPYF